MPPTVSERDQLVDFFHCLSPDAQAAALVYGVVEPHVCTAPQVALILRHADIRSDGLRLTHTQLQDAGRELVKHGLAYAPRRGGGLRASRHWAPWLAMEAHGGGTLDMIVAAHDHVYPRLSYYDDEARTAMALRCNTVAGRFTRIYGDAFGPEEWGFLAEPGAAGLLRTLPEVCRDRALAGCLMRVINAAAPPEPIIEACRELGSDPSEFAAEMILSVLALNGCAATTFPSTSPVPCNACGPARTPDIISGKVHKPDGDGPFPALVSLHGCNGRFSSGWHRYLVG